MLFLKEFKFWVLMSTQWILKWININCHGTHSTLGFGAFCRKSKSLQITGKSAYRITKKSANVFKLTQK